VTAHHWLAEIVKAFHRSAIAKPIIIHHRVTGISRPNPVRHVAISEEIGGQETHASQDNQSKYDPKDPFPSFTHNVTPSKLKPSYHAHVNFL
jgi:hypothetical protein